MKKIMIMEAGHFCKGFAMFVAATIFLAASPSVSAAMDMVEGEWENVTQMMMEGMPFSLPPVTMTQCLSRKDLVPGKDENPDCPIIEQKISGNTLYWKAICKDREGASEVNGEITYAGKSYKGDTRVLVTDRRGRSTTMTMKMTGRYLGPCTGSGTTVNGVPLDSIESQVREIEAAAVEEQRRAAETRRLEEEIHAQEQAAAEAAARQAASEQESAATGRSYTAGGRVDRPVDAARDAVKNPVKSIRGVFGL